MSDSEDLASIASGGDDLFGDDDDLGSPKVNILGDDDLASGGSEQGGERRYGSDDGEVQHKVTRILSIPLFRHRTPKTKDGTVWIPSPACSLQY
jgi:hypothetical protein